MNKERRSDRRKLLDVRRDLRTTRTYLAGLVSGVEQYIAWIDDEMKKPSTVERGKRVAQATTSLEFTKDAAKRFGLGVRK